MPVSPLLTAERVVGSSTDKNVVLILVRLYRYRLAFASILSNSNLTKSRFMRLYLLCILWIFGWVPVECYLLYGSLEDARTNFHWSVAHNPALWNDIRLVPSNGHIIYVPYVWLAEAFTVFIFFGFGKEAVNMYRSGLLTLGFGRVFPSLHPEHVRQGSVTSTIRSFGSKAKLLFKRKSSALSYTDSYTSRTVSAVSPASPNDGTFLATIDEQDSEKRSRDATLSSSRLNDQTRDIEKATTHREPSSTWTRLVSAFITRRSKGRSTTDALALTGLTDQHSAARSDISTGERSPTLFLHPQTHMPCEVIVRKEVRLGVEPAATLPIVVYHAS